MVDTCSLDPVSNPSIPGPTVDTGNVDLGRILSSQLSVAIDKGLFSQELTTSDGMRLRFGVRTGPSGELFFAENSETNEAVSLIDHEPRRTRSGLIIKLNELRKLRPASPILKAGRGADIDFDPVACRFGCLDANAPNSILNRAVLLRIVGRHYEFAVLPQLAPLEPAHLLLVPCAGGNPPGFPHTEQVLDERAIDDLLAMAATARDWIFIFNSLHAGATVRHLHLQALRLGAPLPIEAATIRRQNAFSFVDDWRFPGGGLVFESNERSKLVDTILALQSRLYPLNLLVCGTRSLLFARDLENEIVDLFPFSCFAAMEFGGIIYTASQEAFDRATDETVGETLRKTALDAERLLRILGAS